VVAMQMRDEHGVNGRGRDAGLLQLDEDRGTGVDQQSAAGCLNENAAVRASTAAECVTSSQRCHNDCGHIPKIVYRARELLHIVMR